MIFHIDCTPKTPASPVACETTDSSGARGVLTWRWCSNSPINYEPGVRFACPCVPLLEDIGVPPPSLPPLSPSPLPGVCLWHRLSSLRRVCASPCVCVWRAPSLPPSPSASRLHLLQSLTNTHLSPSLFLLFSHCLPISTHQKLFFLSFFLSCWWSQRTPRTMESGGEMGQSVVVTLEY